MAQAKALVSFVALVVTAKNGGESIGMVQVNAHTVQGAVNLKKKHMDVLETKMSDDDMLQYVQSLPNASDWGKLSKQVTDLMTASLAVGKSTDDLVAQGVSNFCQTCDTTMANTQTNDIDPLVEEESTRQGNHRTCRQEEFVTIGNESTTCATLDNLKASNWNVPTSGSTPSQWQSGCGNMFTTDKKQDAGAIVEQDPDWTIWQAGALIEYATKYKACDSAKGDMAGKEKTCSRSQSSYELEACALYTARNGMCNMYDQCRSTCTGDETDKCADIVDRAASRTLFCTQSNEIACIMTDAFKGKTQDDKVTDLQAVIAACRSATYEQICDVYSVTCPASPIPIVQTCNRGLYPGQQDWFDREYLAPSGELHTGASAHPADAVLSCPVGGHGSAVTCSNVQRKSCSSNGEHCHCTSCPDGSFQAPGNSTVCITACDATVDCSAHGTTDDMDKSDGCTCSCAIGWSGESCSSVVVNKRVECLSNADWTEKNLSPAPFTVTGTKGYWGNRVITTLQSTCHSRSCNGWVAGPPSLGYPIDDAHGIFTLTDGAAKVEWFSIYNMHEYDRAAKEIEILYSTDGVTYHSVGLCELDNYAIKGVNANPKQCCKVDPVEDAKYWRISLTRFWKNDTRYIGLSNVRMYKQ